MLQYVQVGSILHATIHAGSIENVFNPVRCFRLTEVKTKLLASGALYPQLVQFETIWHGTV